MNKFACMAVSLLLGCAQACPAYSGTQSQPPATRLQSLAELSAPTETSRTLKIHGWKSPLGGKVLFIRTPELPMFDLHVSFAAGSAHDGEHPGLAAATFSLVTEAVPGKDLAAIMETFDGLGAKFDMNIDRDRTSFSLRSLSAANKREPALRLFSQILGQPLLSDDSLVEVKKELTNMLRHEQLDPASQITQALNDLMLAGHPYAQPVYGTEKSVGTLTRKQVQTFHQQAYGAANVQITLVGDLTLEQAQAISVNVIDALPAGAVTPATIVVPRRQSPAPSRHIERSQSQTHIMLGQSGVVPGHADYVALTVAHMIFGGQQSSSRLMTQLREQRGLTYGAYLTTVRRQAGRSAMITFKTSPQFSAGAVKLVQSMYREYVQTGPTQQELDDTLLQLRSRMALDSASNAQVLTRLVKINQFDFPLDLGFSTEQAQSLTVEQIKSALNRHFDADQWSVVTLGPTVEQKALPLPTDDAPQSMCRAETGFVAS